MNFGYIANGKLYVRLGETKPVEIRSAFAQQVFARHQKTLEKQSWKSRQAGEGFLAYDVWNQQGRVSDQAVVRLLSVTPGPQTTNPAEAVIYYTLRTETVGGLFRYHLADQEEQRIFHKENLELLDLRHHPEQDKLLCSAGDGEGRSIAVLGNDRFDIEFVTEGDSIDASPCWVPGSRDEVVYQSTGIGRNQDGRVVGYGNCTIEKVDLSTGFHEVLLEDERHDYLEPRLDRAGNLYCIRRPYSRSGRRVSHVESAKDFLLIPCRLLKALYGFLDMMTRVFGKEGLTNASTGKKHEIDVKAVSIKGAMLDVSKVDQSEEDASVIPADWELIRVAPDGQVDTLGSRVGSFELVEEGSTDSPEVLFTNGITVYTLGDRGRTRVLRSKEIIEAVTAL